MWFFISLLAPLLYTGGFLVDKFMLSAHEKHVTVGSIIIFSGAFSIITLPLILFFEPQSFNVDPHSALLMALNGALTVIAVLLYLYAIRDVDVFSVVVALQTIPVFGYIIAFIALGETMTVVQLLGAVIVVGGATALSLEQKEDRRIPRIKQSLLFAFGSAVTFALSGVVFKVFAKELDNGYWRTEFWEYIGIAVFTLLLFLFVKTYRKNVLRLIKSRSKLIIGGSFAAEFFIVTGDLVLNFATLLAPIALVYVINSLQPAFVFLTLLIAGLFFPKLAKQMKKEHEWYELYVVIMMVVGTGLLYI